MDNQTSENLEVTPKKPLLQRLKDSGCFSPFYTTVMLLFAVSLVIYILSRFITPLAEFWARYPSNGIRYLMSALTSWIPFSVSECIIILLPVLFVSYIVYSFRFIKRNGEHFGAKVIMPLVSVVLIIGTLFLSMFAPCYFRNNLTDNLGIKQEKVSAQELYETAMWLASEAGVLSNEITYSAKGESHMPFSYDEMIVLINDAYKDYSSRVDYISGFSSNPKPISLSEPMTYTHISGVYTFFTGEANININYPDFVIPYTVAHEMAHQRGIAREEEANMVAFLVCLESSNSYVKYSGIVNVLNYVESALYKADKNLYKKYSASCPQKLKSEDVAYSEFFDKYRESIANKVTSSVNNTFLQSQGQQQGTKSYGLVVDLTVAYYKSLK